MTDDDKKTIPGWAGGPEDDVEDLLGATVDADKADATLRRNPRVKPTLARLTLDDVIPRSLARRLDAGEALALVLQVPSADWCAPLETAIITRWRCYVVARDGSARTQHKPTLGNDKVTEKLIAGFSVIGISQNPALLLPSALLTTADAYLVVRPPGPRLIRQLLKTCVGRPIPRIIPPDVTGGLSFDEISGAFRYGASARLIIDLLARAVATKTRVSVVDKTPPLQDLAGYGDAKDWGLALAADVQAWRRGDLAWPLSSAAILSGPPGTGKSLFAKALAISCGTPIVVTSVGAWFSKNEGNLGDVIQAAQAAWDSARAIASSGGVTLFIDEIDGLPDRSTMTDRGKEWWTPLVNFCLTLFDGAVTDRTGIILLGATNHFDNLDAALVRSGRFEKRFDIKPPGPEDLAHTLRLHLGDALQGADLVPFARLRPGSTGADAARWAREAQSLARAAGRAINASDLMAVIAPPDPRPESEIRLVAVHEAGHAVVNLAVGLRVSSVSIIETKGRGGATVAQAFLTSFPTAAQIEATIIAVLAGRAAEEIFLGSPSAGAETDLANASALAASLHGSVGLGATLVHLTPSNSAASLLLLDPILRGEVDAHLGRLYVRSLEIIRARRKAVMAVADELVKRRMLSGAELAVIVSAADVPNAQGGHDV
jgi:DNA polymerase III delta prime subunit